MAFNRGPKIEKDGLVLYYDTENSKSYKGEPTINYIHSQNAVAQSSYVPWSATGLGSWNSNHPNAIRAYNADGGDITGYYNSGVGNAQDTRHAHWQYDTVLKKPVVVMNDVSGRWKAKSFGTGLGTWTSQGKGHGDTYTISWLQWVDNLSKNAKAGLYTKNLSGGNGFHDGQANSTSSYNTKLRTWERVYQTYTTSSVRDLNQSMASIYMYGHYNVRATVKIADVQFNWGNHATQFSEVYERTSNQSLFNLMKNTNGLGSIPNNINLNSVSFDSDAQIVFDGTDDTISIGNSSGLGIMDSMSVFSWVKLDSTGGWNGIFGGSISGFVHFQLYNGGVNVYVYGPNAAYGNPDGVSIGTNVWTNVGFTFGNNELKVYVNGELQPTVPTGNGANISGNSDVRIGWSYNETRVFHGKIPMLKVYNKELTPSEVNSNYSSMRSRFGL